MRRFIQSILNRTGYEVRRLNPRKAVPNVFVEMQQLCTDDNPVIFDVGAHYGETALKFRKAFPDAKIYSFEPFPDSFTVLQEKVSHDTNTAAFNYGLSNVNDELEFNSNIDSATNSLLSTDATGTTIWEDDLLTTTGTVRAKFNTLDTVIRELDLPRINILKLDVQGAEYLVMEGAAKTLRQARIDIVYTEIITQPAYVGQKRFDQALSVFYESGFDLYNLYYPSARPGEKLRQIDAIFTRNI